METIGQLTSGLAHDFNNQLSSVVMAFQLMKSEVGESGSAKLQTRLLLAEQAINRATSLAENLLRFSRHRPRDLCTTSPNEVIESMLDLIQTAIGGSSQITTCLSPDVWRIRTNVAQLESSLLNIALNARDAAQHGIRLVITTANIQPEKPQPLWSSSKQRAIGHVRISVKDNGCGMSEELIDKIFTPFFTTKESGKGTGLGLAMVKGFVSDMNGKLEVESIVGHGTTMHLYFPKDESAALAP